MRRGTVSALLLVTALLVYAAFGVLRSASVRTRAGSGQRRRKLDATAMHCFSIVGEATTDSHVKLLLSMLDGAGCDDARVFSSRSSASINRLHHVYNQSTWRSENWDNQMLQVSNAILAFYSAGGTRPFPFAWLVKFERRAEDRADGAQASPWAPHNLT